MLGRVCNFLHDDGHVEQRTCLSALLALLAPCSCGRPRANIGDIAWHVLAEDPGLHILRARVIDCNNDGDAGCGDYDGDAGCNDYEDDDRGDYGGDAGCGDCDDYRATAYADGADNCDSEDNPPSLSPCHR